MITKTQVDAVLLRTNQVRPASGMAEWCYPERLPENSPLLVKVQAGDLQLLRRLARLALLAEIDLGEDGMVQVVRETPAPEPEAKP